MSGKAIKTSHTAPSKRMTAYRERLRAAGLRPVQLWLPDTRSAAFARQCAREAEAIAAGGAAEDELQTFVDAVSDWPQD